MAVTPLQRFTPRGALFTSHGVFVTPFYTRVGVQCGPVVWNTERRSPDISLDVFKARLKTFLFNC